MKRSYRDIVIEEFDLLYNTWRHDVPRDYLTAWYAWCPERHVFLTAQYKCGPTILTHCRREGGKEQITWSRWGLWKKALDVLRPWGTGELASAAVKLRIGGVDERVNAVLEALVFVVSAFAKVFDDLGLDKNEAKLSRQALALLGKAGFPHPHKVGGEGEFGDPWTYDNYVRAIYAVKYYQILNYLRNRSRWTPERVARMVKEWYPMMDVGAEDIFVNVMRPDLHWGMWNSWQELKEFVDRNANIYADEMVKAVRDSRKGNHHHGFLKLEPRHVWEALLFNAFKAIGAFKDLRLDPAEARLSAGAECMLQRVKQS